MPLLLYALPPALLASQARDVIHKLDDVLQQLRGAWWATVQTNRNYLDHKHERLDCRGDQTRVGPGGSEAMESNYQFYQVRFRHRGEFWTQVGDKTFMGLATLWRNDPWEHLLPHGKPIMTMPEFETLPPTSRWENCQEYSVDIQRQNPRVGAD